MATNKRRVMVPSNMGKEGVDILRARDDIEVITYPHGITQAELLPLLGDVSGIALSATPYRQAELDASPAMQVVARIGVGFDAVEVPALSVRKIPLLTTGIANSTSVAEQAVFFIMAIAKRVAELDAAVKQGRWNDRFVTVPSQLAGKTALVVGFGRIGTRSAKRLAALEMNVLVYDPFVPAETITAAGHEAVADLDAALPRADYVTIHCPKSPATIDMFDAARLAKMKQGAGLVNTARGGIVNEDALYDALTSGHLRGAGLDVFDVEPAPASKKILQLDSMFAAPHMAGVTVESIIGMAVATANNILSVLDGKPNRDNVVNKDVLT
jgi:D-3-phosphoglycerate dehydrogenase